MASPELSVLMPVYNGAATLARTLASLPADQPALEVVLVDQGSTDASAEIARRFSDRLALRFLPAPQNVNWMQNTNLALREARAPLASFLHQDDMWMPNRLDMLLDFAGRYPEASLWVHGARYIDALDRPIGSFRPPFGNLERLIPGPEALRRLLVQNTIALPATMVRRETVLRTGGLDEALWYTADWELWLRLARLGDVAWSPRIMAAFRVHSSSLTITGSRDAEGFIDQLAIPLERHLEALSAPEAARIRERAEVSNALNAWLAKRYHGQSGGGPTLLRRFLALGPGGCAAFLRDSRILQRLIPRLKLALRARAGSE